MSFTRLMGFMRGFGFEVLWDFLIIFSASGAYSGTGLWVCVCVCVCVVCVCVCVVCVCVWVGGRVGGWVRARACNPKP